MRRNRSLIIVVSIAALALVSPARAELTVQGVDQGLPVGTPRSLVVAQFFDLRADSGGRFADRITRDLFGRAPTADELRSDRDRLRFQITHDALVWEKLKADEYLGIVVDTYFVRIHDRLPDAAERQHYQHFLRGGFRESDLIVELLTAEPYAPSQFETDPQAWLDDLFRRLTDRTPSAIESSALLMLYSMNYDLFSVVQVIANSEAVRTRLISEIYQKLLLRNPTAAEIATHLAEFAAGLREMDFRAHRLLSAEYADRDVAPSYTATVDWGDGRQSEAIILPNFDGGFVVSEHTYAAAGDFTATTTVTSDLGPSAAGRSALNVYAESDTDPVQIFTLFAGYLDGPAEPGLRPGETTGAAEGAYLEDPNASQSDIVVAGQTDESAEPSASIPEGSTCGFGAPLVTAVVPILCLGGLRRQRNRADLRAMRLL